MEGFKLWLHPINGHQSPSPLRISELRIASTHDERISLLRKMCCAVSIFEVNAIELIEVNVDPEGFIVPSKHVGLQFRLPLQLSQIAQYDIGQSPVPRRDGVLGFVAYGHPMSAYRASWHSESGACESSPDSVWIFVVTHDVRSETSLEKRESNALSGATTVFARNGAISGDLNAFEEVSNRGSVGTFGTVRFVRRSHGSDSRIYAGKIFDSKKAQANACVECHYLLAARQHPNIVAFLGAFCVVAASGKSKWMILTESHLKGDMEQQVRHHGVVSERASLEIAKDVLSALTHLHEHAIMHRDVKPSNVVQASDGRAVLIDLGLAVHVSEHAKLKNPCGSPGFIAPEILQRRGCQMKSDVFGCGALLYFVASGIAPFAGSSRKQTIRRNRRALVSFDDPRFLAVGWQTVEIMRYMLMKSVRRRPAAPSACEAITLLIEVIPPATLPEAISQTTDHVQQSSGDPSTQGPDSTWKHNFLDPLPLHSSLKSFETVSCCSGSSSSSSNRSLFGAARQKLNGKQVKSRTAKTKKALRLFHLVKRTQAEQKSDVNDMEVGIP
eukprot:TRINITY_DN9354_c0_g1_i1.p1 TRINITY_DN9354_c0_g1~~TRINITY_DN9354_c0_g1_i1.p1  ORF type:complete len:575 (-),score=71.08 TRINITY_DN9354_c0_g1_i1:515-2182(-)